jgi:ABC-2 type transport system permease protein
MKQLPMLVRREFWEHKSTFFWLPLVTTGVVISILLLLLVGMQSDAVDVSMDYESDQEQHQFVVRDSSLMDLFGYQLKKLEAAPERVIEDRLDQIYSGVSIIWFAILWVVIFFYLIGALYDDRKDRSVLFWKSMPVSDTLTVGSKLFAGLVLAPAIYLGFTMIAHLAIVSIASIAALGQDVAIWDTLWVPANLVGRWLAFVGLYGFTLLWCLPFFAWLLLVSSWAKSAPLAWAVGIPIVLMLVEGALIDSNIVATFIRQHIFSFEFWQHGRHLMHGFELPEALEMFASLVVGMAFIAAAIWFRGKADEL